MSATRLSIALATIHLIRKETNPALTRYEILLTLAGSTQDGKPVPLTTYEIGCAMDEPGQGNGSIQSMLDLDLIIETTKGNTNAYHLSDTGLQEVQRILLGQPKAKPAPQPNMAVINSNHAASQARKKTHSPR